MFKQFSNSSGYVIGVDLADRPSDVSVATVMKKNPDGTVEIISSDIIRLGCVPEVQQEQIFKKYENYLERNERKRN